jgi:hypothetical protein
VQITERLKTHFCVGYLLFVYTEAYFYSLFELELVNLNQTVMIKKNFRPRRTREKAASNAGKVLRDPNSTPEQKSAAGSALVQRRWS